jgi:pyrrolysine biosynthesis protein PylD
MAAITITDGEGAISGFAEMLAEAGKLLGMDALAMTFPDQKGFKEAWDWGAEVVVYSDDNDFVAKDLVSGHTIHNNPATSRIFVAALEFLSHGSLAGKEVLVMGLGPVGTFAALRLLELGAKVHLYDVDPSKGKGLHRRVPELGLIQGEAALLKFLESQGPLILEAVPSENLLSSGDPGDLARIIQGRNPHVSAPGVPLSWPRDWMEKGAKEGPQLYHEPLLSGTVSMLSGLLAKDYREEHGAAYPEAIQSLA